MILIRHVNLSSAKSLDLSNLNLKRLMILSLMYDNTPAAFYLIHYVLSNLTINIIKYSYNQFILIIIQNKKKKKKKKKKKNKKKKNFFFFLQLY